MTAQQSGSARFLKALAVEEYDTLLAGITVKGPDPEAVLVPEASGRVASQDVTSPIDVPSFPKSRVDGYALKAESTFTASDESPVPLYLAGSIEMGEVPSFSLDSINDCIYVPTGGIIPDGADAVVKVEFTTERKSSSKGKTTIHVAKAVVPGQGTLGRGSDMKQGETIVKTNTVLSTATIGSLAAAGLTTVHVHRKPRVGLFSTGNELLEPGLPFGPGKIYDVNRIILKTRVQVRKNSERSDINRFGQNPHTPNIDPPSDGPVRAFFPQVE